jgi:drug/metabolite transporter (DMT)-like permease
MAAAGRTAILLITRATLQDADPQMTTWNTIACSTAVLGLIALVTWNWQGPASAGGWAALVGVGFGTTIAVMALFVSIKRIGPFRSALIMYLEPLLSTILSAPVLGEVLTPWQMVGGAIMLTALISFQLRR